MTTRGLYSVEEIYELLPAVHRARDAEQGHLLRELVEVITEQVNVIAESLEQMYDDQFIETAAEWVAPYIGDLVGYRTLHGVVPRVASPRAEVANTIAYRRRKGTASMLEQLARDVTGWPARVVEYFELIGASQFMNHVRGHATATANLRGAEWLELATTQNGAFDPHPHTVDVRSVERRAGRYGIADIGIFLWRLAPDELRRSPLVAADGSERRYRFDQLGADRQLFATARTEEEITHLAEPFDVPMPLTTRWVHRHLARYYGANLSLQLELDDGTTVDAIPPEDVHVCDLSDDPANPGSWQHEPRPGDGYVAVDPRLGRVAFADAPSSGITRLASFHHGMVVPVGGGGYDRAATLDSVDLVIGVSAPHSLVAPLNDVAAGGAVEIRDNARHHLPPSVAVTAPPLGADDQRTVLRSMNRSRPHLSRSDQVKIAAEPDTTLVLDGLVIEQAPLVLEEFADTAARHLVLRHCTLVPGLQRTGGGLPVSPARPSLIVLHPFASVTIERCILGPVVAVEDTEVTVLDSIIDSGGRAEIAFCGRDAPSGGGLRTVTSAGDRQTGDGLAPGGHLSMDSCTVVGRIHADRMDISNSIVLAESGGAPDPWPAPLWAERRQVGCIRFSFVPEGARSPRQYRCVPRHGVSCVPQHTSLRFGDSAYAQLRRSTGDAIRRGAEDESEMGVTRSLYQPQREANLRVRLDEYLRFGLEAGIFEAT